MKKAFFTVLFAIQLMAVFPNLLILKGVVVDIKSGNPVPFVNIAVSGTYQGTVSNGSGEFVLHLPNSLKSETITFSCIGYETYELKPPQSSKIFSVKLTPHTYQVGEITVMPDSTLRTLIRKAYRKIPDNYPAHSTIGTGFYREAIQTKDGTYLLLTEAMLDIFKTSYKSSEPGQVRIGKSRKFISSGIDSVNDVRFYGGHFIAHNADLVKRRHPIVQASNRYKYKLSGTVKIGNRELYAILFEHFDVDAEGYIGKMYIDKETLAFEKFEYYSNEERLKWREKELFARLSSKEANNIVMYAPTDGKYFLRTATYTEKCQSFKTGHLLEHFSEYILVENLPYKAKPMPYAEISPYSTIIAHEATPYSEADWRDYPVVPIEETMLMSKNISDSIFMSGFHKTAEEKKQAEKLEKIMSVLNIIERFDFEYNFLHQTVYNQEGFYELYSSLQKPVSGLQASLFPSSSGIWHFETSINYQITKKIGALLTASANMANQYYSETGKLGIVYILPLKTYGRKFFLMLQPGYKLHYAMHSLGKSDQLYRIRNGELKLKDGKSEVYWGSRSHGLDGRISLRYQFSRQLWLNAFAGYYQQMGSKPMLRFEDKNGNLFTNKSKNIELDKSGYVLYINSLPTEKPMIELMPFYLGFGIVLAL